MNDSPIGKYHTLGTLGQGAHSKILHIRRSSDAKQYALKVVAIEGGDDHKYLEQAQHEFRIGQALDHPNLVKIYTLEEEKDWLFRIRKVNLLIEYVNGKTLDTAPTLSVPQLLHAFVRVAAGLVHLHKKGFLHADLKPNNIMLGRNGAVKIIDYGLAWIKGKSKGRIQGTPEYMAPETAKQKKVNEQTDIYNLGATMYRMFTGELPPLVADPDGISLPIDGATFFSLLKPVKELNPHAPKLLAELIHDCLAFDATKRPQRASEIQGVLDRMADALTRKPEDRLEAIDWD